MEIVEAFVAFELIIFNGIHGMRLERWKLEDTSNKLFISFLHKKKRKTQTNKQNKKLFISSSPAPTISELVTAYSSTMENIMMLVVINALMFYIHK